MSDNLHCQVCGGAWDRCNCCELCMVHERAIGGCECGAAFDSAPSFTVWINPDGTTTTESNHVA